MWKTHSIVTSTCLGFFLITFTTTGINGRIHRFNTELGLRRGWCPESCKLTEETPSCGEVSKLRQTPNLTEICQTLLNENFETVEACEERCQGCEINKVLNRCFTKNLEKKYAVCKLPPKTGKCPGYFLAWYYDHKFGDCQKFVYGGCGGNGNRFQDLSTCLERCGLLGVIYPVENSRRLTHQEL